MNTNTTRRTGTIHRYAPPKPGEPHGHYIVRCSAPDGSRPLFHLDPEPASPESREAALVAAAELSEALWAKGLGAAPKAERRALSTDEVAGGREWWDRFFEVRESRKIYPMRGNYTKHIQPAFDIPWQTATMADVERFRDSLDSRVAAGELAPKTAFNIWTLFRTAAKAATGNWRKGDKQRSLKVCDRDPTESVAGPDYDPRDEGKELQWLYPREVLAVASCAGVPLAAKRRIVLATYLCVRGGELAALTWDKIDLERRVVIVDDAYNQERKATKKTKTGNRGRRRYSIEPALMPLLHALHDETGGTGPIIKMPVRHEWAVELRRALKAAC